jgi:hypothetical protein
MEKDETFTNYILTSFDMVSAKTPLNITTYNHLVIYERRSGEAINTFTLERTSDNRGLCLQNFVGSL